MAFLVLGKSVFKHATEMSKRSINAAMEYLIISFMQMLVFHRFDLNHRNYMKMYFIANYIISLHLRMVFRYQFLNRIIRCFPEILDFCSSNGFYSIKYERIEYV